MSKTKMVTTCYQRELIEGFKQTPLSLFGADEDLKNMHVTHPSEVHEPFVLHPDHQEMLRMLDVRHLPDGRFLMPADEQRYIDAYIADPNKYRHNNDVIVVGAGSGTHLNLCYEFPLVSLKEKPEPPKCSPLFAKLMKRI